MAERVSPFAHVVADKAPLYRAIMGVFADARAGFVVHLRPEDVLTGLEVPATTEDIVTALEQLRDWGNVRADPDTGRVTSLDDFNRSRYLYQLTREGEAAETALAAYDEALGRRGELQAVALGDVRVHLRGLAALAAEDDPDPGKVHQLLRSLAERFEGLAGNAQAFMSSLQRTIDLHDADEEAFLAYKDHLIGYIERFVGDLVIASGDIGTLLADLDDRVDTLLLLAAEREAADAAPGEARDVLAERLGLWRSRWRGLRSWFAGGAGAPSQAQLLRRRARQAITALLGVVAELNERRSGRSDRSADYRELARWFAEAPTEGDCHRLWRAAFGLAPARHLTVDADTLAWRRDDPIAPSTAWADAPPVEISPRLRRTGSHERRGKVARVEDRSRERAHLAATMAAESAQTELARRRLSTGGWTRLSLLPELDPDAFGLFLALLGEALARGGGHGRPVHATTADGALEIVMEPTGDGATATIVAPAGVLRGPDHHVVIRLSRPGSVALDAPGAAGMAAVTG